MALRIRNLRSRWRRVVSFTPRLLYPQVNSFCCLLVRRPVGSQRRPGSLGEKILLPPSGTEIRFVIAYNDAITIIISFCMF